MEAPYVRRNHERTSVQLNCGDVSRTIQADKDKCDINLMVERATEGGVFTHGSNKRPMYADVSTAVSLFEALNEVMAAEEEFGALPSKVRTAAQNDPQELLAMLESQEGREVLEEAGMDFTAPQAPVEIVDPGMPEVPPAKTPPVTGGD